MPLRRTLYTRTMPIVTLTIMSDHVRAQLRSALVFASGILDDEHSSYHILIHFR